MSRKKKKKAKAPEIFQSLSKQPNGSWPQRTAYHGARVLLVILLGGGITLLFATEERELPELPQIGTVAPEDVAAEVGFVVPRDSAELDRARADAADAVPPVFEEHAETQGRVEAELDGFFDRIEAAVAAGGRPAVEGILRDEGLPEMVDQAEFFLNPLQLQALREAESDVVRQLTDRVLDLDHPELEQAVLSAGAIMIIRADRSEQTLDAGEFLWGTDFHNEARDALPPSTSEFQAIAGNILTHFFESPYRYDVSRTEAQRIRRRASVPITEGDSVVVGEVFVRQRSQIGPFQYRALQVHQAALQAQGLIQEVGRDWGAVLGSFLLNLLLLSVFGVLLFFYRPEVYASYRWVFLLAFLVAVYFSIGAGISSLEGEYWQFLPIAFVVLPVAILWDGRMALILALVLGVITGTLEPFRTPQILAFTVMGGGAAALSARAIRRRSQTWIFISLITLGYALALTAFGLKEAAAPGGVLVSIVYAGSNAIVSSILAMGFMPVFEWFTGITTDQSLLEWADPNRPLLKSLSLEASGTYAHTINVANLAEAAATAIGANGLLSRIGVYYHDVGKMLKPQYFVENQPGGRNPHDKLKPHTSASIVREHVVEGEKMARNEGVPDVVARFIPEHHGTQLIGFFYERAREESEEEPDQEEFRYPGPKPRSKETAIAMLADSVESATRALQDPSPQRVQELVQTIVDGKIRDGQLSEAPLTLGEITKVQEQFVKVVSGMFHHRLDYPATRHITESPTDEGETDDPETDDGKTDDPETGDGKTDDGQPQRDEEGAKPHPEPDTAQQIVEEEGASAQDAAGEGDSLPEGPSNDEQLPLTPAQEPDIGPGPHER